MTDREFLDRLKDIRESRSGALKATHKKRLRYAQLRDELRALVPYLTVGVKKDEFLGGGIGGQFQFQGQLSGTPRFEDPDFEADFKQANSELNRLCAEYLFDLEKQ